MTLRRRIGQLKGVERGFSMRKMRRDPLIMAIQPSQLGPNRCSQMTPRAAITIPDVETAVLEGIHLVGTYTPHYHPRCL
jgi:hypothetical protein